MINFFFLYIFELEKFYLTAFHILRVNADKRNEDFRQLYGSIVGKKGRVLPHYNNVKYNGSLMLSNSHILTGDSVALPQNFKHVGGFHIKDTAEPLPEVK